MFLLCLQVNRGAHHLRGLVFWVVLGSPVHLSRSELSTINIRESRMNMAIEFAPHYQSAKNEARVYCRRDLLLENERHHREEHIRKARHRRRQLNANACNHPQPSSHRSVRLASGYCLAICWIWNLVDSNAKQTRGTLPSATTLLLPLRGNWPGLLHLLKRLTNVCPSEILFISTFGGQTLFHATKKQLQLHPSH